MLDPRGNWLVALVVRLAIVLAFALPPIVGPAAMAASNSALQVQSGHHEPGSASTSSGVHHHKTAHHQASDTVFAGKLLPDNDDRDSGNCGGADSCCMAVCTGFAVILTDDVIHMHSEASDWFAASSRAKSADDSPHYEPPIA